MEPDTLSPTNRGGRQKPYVGSGPAPNPLTLQEIVRRIAEVAAPEKILIFGSAARGEMGPNSDIDLLVVKSGPFHRGRLAEEIYMRLYGVGQAVDIVIVTPEELQRYRNSHAVVVGPAGREGRLLYAA